MSSISSLHVLPFKSLLAAASLVFALLLSPFSYANTGPSVQALRFIGEQQISTREQFLQTTVGGLSGIDYDASKDRWILASDDRSDFDQTRFYTAALAYNEQSFDSVTLTAVTRLKQENGHTYPRRWFGGESADVEAIRFDPVDGSVWYTSEGDRGRGLDPFIRRASNAGLFIEELPTHTLFTMRQHSQTGPRNNLAFEGLTFTPDGQSLWTAMEAPLWQDGPLPSTSVGAMVRMTQYSRSGQVLKQVAYPVDAIPATPGRGKFADNGVTEILAIDDERFLVAERSAVQNAAGKYSNFIRIYEMDISGATDISGFTSLAAIDFQPVVKRLVLDLNTLALPKLDNIEGMAWGPRLANGNASLVLVSDDNFNASQVTQFLAFEVLMHPKR
ncbi:esterase-like activity of phytase family protein [Candidimonas sp. SYP-B2681]|uniref:esterase-like activity of phytase family protein n=1 Tax=Candidimonas sp. SYP-B2681 TaxID=2497686 RepID=UPI000F86006D|nr:esterase-like activity of phytase family protein [Candidimonas sp. SYP-B2681]RTZ41563.1 esterase-like activity of phytase family protein [Candidimonas sp. SYP-B2681]